MRHADSLPPLNILSTHEKLICWTNVRTSKWNCENQDITESVAFFSVLSFYFVSSFIFITHFYYLYLNCQPNSTFCYVGFNFCYERVADMRMEGSNRYHACVFLAQPFYHLCHTWELLVFRCERLWSRRSESFNMYYVPGGNLPKCKSRNCRSVS